MGSLQIIIGPMFSGKTEMLINKYNEILVNNNNNNIIAAYNYYKDTRYGSDIIASHSGMKINSFNIEQLSEILTSSNFNEQKYIFINEAQFFPELKYYIIKLVEEYNKHVIICGLDCDYKREKFGDIWDIIPLADEIYKLKGICNYCKIVSSMFTFRITSEINQELIGTENYVSLCRKCYICQSTSC